MRWAVLAAAVGLAGERLAAGQLRAASPVERIIAAARLDAAKKDEFAESAMPPIEGQRFAISYPLKSGRATGDNITGYYAYKAGVLSLELYPSVVVRDGAGGYLGSVSGLIFRARRVAGSRYSGTNAYGARATVSVTRLDQDGLLFYQSDTGVRDAPDGELPRNVETNPVYKLIKPKRDQYYLDITAAPSEARAIASDVSVVVEGKIAKVGDRLGVCDSLYSGPTIDNPSEIYGSSCYAGVSISRIAFVRKSTGAVLKEWARPSS